MYRCCSRLTICCLLSELPERSRSGKLVREERPLLTIGLKHTEFDSYDPGNYDHNAEDYQELDFADNEIGNMEAAKTAFSETSYHQMRYVFQIMRSHLRHLTEGKCHRQETLQSSTLKLASSPGQSM